MIQKNCNTRKDNNESATSDLISLNEWGLLQGKRKCSSRSVGYEPKGKDKSKKEYKCEFNGCEKVYYSLYRLKIHLRVHEGTKPFTCEICDKAFNEKGNLKTHMLIHTGDKPFECTVSKCKRKFRTYGHLKDHMSTHFDMRVFDCEVCGLSFSRKWTLKKHMYTHTGEKPFSCTFCNRRFSDKSNLATHLKKHKNGKNEEITESDKFSKAGESSDVFSLVSAVNKFSIIENGVSGRNTNLLSEMEAEEMIREAEDEMEHSYMSPSDNHSTYNFSTGDLYLFEDNDFVFRPSCFRPSHFNDTDSPHFCEGGEACIDSESNLNVDCVSHSQILENFDNLQHINNYESKFMGNNSDNLKIIDFEKGNNIDADKILYQLFVGKANVN